MEGADDGRDPAPIARGAGDRLAHTGLAGKVHRGHPARGLGVPAQRPADAQGGPAYGLGGAPRGEDLHGAVPHVVAVPAGSGRGERRRERGGRLGGRDAGVVPGRRVAPTRVRHRQVAAHHLHPALPGPADRGEFGGEVGEGVEAEPSAVTGPRQRDRCHGAGSAEMGEPGLEVGGEFYADDLGARGVQQGGHRGGERRAVVPYAQQVRDGRVGEGGEGRPRFLNACHRRFSRRSQSRRQVADPSSARRRTGPSQ